MLSHGTDAALPVLVTSEGTERADAARNRLKILAAAERLFAERGIATVTMDDIAAAAEVGKGTLYRRFGDKSGLAAALLDDRETMLQRQMIFGSPPLGPGAAPADRLAAFATAYLRYVDTHLDLVEMSQNASTGARLRTGSHRLWQFHCRYLLTDAGAPDPDIRADVLLGMLTAEQVRHWRHDGRSMDSLEAAVMAIARQLATP
jgi:AcrR family transcriptional regulator